MKNNSMVEFLLKIRTRTPMYIGGGSIFQLKAFLDGWVFGAQEDILDYSILSDFQLWVANKFCIKSSQSWAQIIMFYSNDEYDALDKFFVLFDQYLLEKNS